MRVKVFVVKKSQEKVSKFPKSVKSLHPTVYVYSILLRTLLSLSYLPLLLVYVVRAEKTTETQIPF